MGMLESSARIRIRVDDVARLPQHRLLRADDTSKMLRSRFFASVEEVVVRTENRQSCKMAVQALLYLLCAIGRIGLVEWEPRCRIHELPRRLASAGRRGIAEQQKPCGACREGCCSKNRKAPLHVAGP